MSQTSDAHPSVTLPPWRRRLVGRLARGVVALLGSNTRLRNRVLRGLLDSHLAPGVLCLVPFDDHALYVDPRDDKVALKLLSGRPWQRRELETTLGLLRQAGRLRPDGIFIDVGANIGSQTVYALLSGAFSRAIAIEPDPHNFDILQRNLAINGLEDRVLAVRAAASATSGTLQLVHHGKNYGAHSVEPSFIDNPAGAVSVVGTTLDELLQQYGVTPVQVGLVKIDVEGHELSVLQGMGSLRGARVPVLMELNASPKDAERISAFKALFAPHERMAVNLSDTTPPTTLSQLVWTTPQADLLVY